MKEHISITIDLNVAKRLKKAALQERRSVSQVVEMAVEKYLGDTGLGSEQLVTTKSAFKGAFAREDTYGSR